MMTNQQIFETVWKGLESQGFKQSMLKSESGADIQCAYRGLMV